MFLRFCLLSRRTTLPCSSMRMQIPFIYLHQTTLTTISKCLLSRPTDPTRHLIVRTLLASHPPRLSQTYLIPSPTRKTTPVHLTHNFRLSHSKTIPPQTLSQNVADDNTSILDNPNDKRREQWGLELSQESAHHRRNLSIFHQSRPQTTRWNPRTTAMWRFGLRLKEEAPWQSLGFLQIETRLVWLECAIVAMTSPHEWKAWIGLRMLVRMRSALGKKERKKKEEADEQKVEVHDSALWSESPPKSAPKSKFPGRAGLIVDVVVGFVFCGALSCCFGILYQVGCMSEV